MKESIMRQFDKVYYSARDTRDEIDKLKQSILDLEREMNFKTRLLNYIVRQGDVPMCTPEEFSSDWTLMFDCVEAKGDECESITVQYDYEKLREHIEGYKGVQLYETMIIKYNELIKNNESR